MNWKKLCSRRVFDVSIDVNISPAPHPKYTFLIWETKPHSQLLYLKWIQTGNVVNKNPQRLFSFQDIALICEVELSFHEIQLSIQTCVWWSRRVCRAWSSFPSSNSYSRSMHRSRFSVALEQFVFYWFDFVSVVSNNLISSFHCSWCFQSLEMNTFRLFAEWFLYICPVSCIFIGSKYWC